MGTSVAKLSFCLFAGMICVDQPLSPLNRFGIAPDVDVTAGRPSERAGTRSQTLGQTVVSLEGGTATFRNVPIPGTGGTTFTTADGRPMIE